MADKTKEVQSAKAAQRRAAELKGQAAQDPNSVIDVVFTGGMNGKAKHREWAGEGDNRVSKLLDKDAPVSERTVRMKQSRFAQLADRFIPA